MIMSVSGMEPPNDGDKAITLRVEEIAKGSAGRFMCRIDTSVIKELDLKPGEIVEIIGKKTLQQSSFPPLINKPILFDSMVLPAIMRV